jgi:hypothetical protein
MCLCILSVPVFPQIVPYVADINERYGLERPSYVSESDATPRLLGTFKIYNPDTVPFYLWVSFESGAKLTHTRYSDLPSVRLVGLEFRYKNAFLQPVVKKFPDGYDQPVFNRPIFGGGWRARRDAKREVKEAKRSGEWAAPRRGGGRHGWAAEIVFWKEDVQGYYEMELWGVLYAPDLKEAGTAGDYVERIKFEIEAMP